MVEETVGQAAQVAPDQNAATPQAAPPNTESPAPTPAVGDAGKQEQQPEVAPKGEVAPPVEKRVPRAVLEQRLQKAEEQYKKLQADHTRKSQRLAQYEKTKEQPQTTTEQVQHQEPMERDPLEGVSPDDPAVPVIRQLMQENAALKAKFGESDSRLELHEQWLFKTELNNQIADTRKAFEADGVKLDEAAVRATIEEHGLELTDGLVRQIALELHQNEVLLAQQRKGAASKEAELLNKQNVSSPAATGARSVGQGDDSKAAGDKEIGGWLRRNLFNDFTKG